jgi:hypothetical protein
MQTPFFEEQEANNGNAVAQCLGKFNTQWPSRYCSQKGMYKYV